MARLTLFLFICCLWARCILCFTTSPPIYSYWVDSSCRTAERKDGFNKALADALVMGDRASQRLGNVGSTTGPYIARWFKTLFHKEVTDVTAFDRVKDMMNAISVLAETTDRSISEVRVYCDDDNFGDDNRWQLVPDEGSDPIPNSQLPRQPKDDNDPGPFQQWEDKTNWIRMSGGSAGCKSRDRQTAMLGELQYRRYTTETNSLFPGGENPARVVLTICDNSFNLAEGGIMYWSIPNIAENSLFPKEANPEGGSWFRINHISDVLSTTIFHELTHMSNPTFDLDDVNSITRTKEDGTEKTEKTEKTTPYEFQTSVKTFNYEEAVKNAETVTFFAAIARFADWGYALDDVPNDSFFLGRMRYKADLERIGGEQYKRAETSMHSRNDSASTGF